MITKTFSIKFPCIGLAKYHCDNQEGLQAIAQLKGLTVFWDHESTINWVSTESSWRVDNIETEEDAVELLSCFAHFYLYDGYCQLNDDEIEEIKTFLI